jgi:hypothetical protein
MSAGRGLLPVTHFPLIKPVHRIRMQQPGPRTAGRPEPEPDVRAGLMQMQLCTHLNLMAWPRTHAERNAPPHPHRISHAS